MGDGAKEEEKQTPSTTKERKEKGGGRERDTRTHTYTPGQHTMEEDMAVVETSNDATGANNST